MKPIISCGGALLLGSSLICLTAPAARATVNANAQNTFTGFSISAASGVVNFSVPFEASSFAQAGAASQYTLSPSVGANASDTPAPGGSATGSGLSLLAPATGTAGATGFVPGTIDGYDTSAGRASANGQFEISGGSQPVSVTFTATIAEALGLSSDNYGVAAEAETVFSFSVNGNPVLFNDLRLNIGPNQTASQNFSDTLSQTMTLMPNTVYSFWAESDSETMVANSSISAVPEPEGLSLGLAGLAVLGVVWGLRGPRSRAVLPTLLGLAALLGGLPARAMYIGSDAPDICLTCGAQPTRVPGGGINTSLTEGNVREDYSIAKLKSGYGTTLNFVANYNSYNADGSKAQLDTGLGYGWSHSFSELLFQQRGEMFRLGADARVTRYFRNYSANGVTYTADTGYFESLSQQPDGSYIVTNKVQSWWRFGAVSNTPFLVAGPVFRLIQMGDRNQNVTTFAYDAQGHLSSAADIYGRTLTFTYDASNKLSTVTDPLGRTTRFQYDALERVPIQITDPLGRVTQYTYNAEYQMTRKVDADGQIFFYQYRSLRPYAVTDGAGQPLFSLMNPSNWSVTATNLAFSLRRSYDPSVTSSTDGNGNVWRYSYDTNGYITNTTAPDGSVTRYTYDPGSFELSSVTDPNGHTTRYQYDPEGNRASMTDALGNVTTYAYDPVFNELTSTTDPNGRTTTYQYDTRGNRLEETDALGQTRHWTYDAHGNILSSTDKRGSTTTYQYDSTGNVQAVTDPLGDITRYSYDAVGNLLSLTDPNGHTTTYVYDALDRLAQTTDPLGHSTRTTYDEAGDILSQTDANGNTTTYSYDQRHRQIARTNAMSGVTFTAYDTNNNIISRTDPNGFITAYSYDSLNRQVQTIDALHGVTTMTYDATGNVLTTVDPNGHTNSYGYDALNRKVQTSDPLGNITTYEYANTGGSPCCGATAGSPLVTGKIDGNGKITYYTYDELNRNVQVIKKSGSTSTNITPSDAVTTTTYDAQDNIIAAMDPNGNITTFTYDAVNRKIGMTNGGGDVTTTTYDAAGNILQKTDARGNVTTYSYDADNRLIQRNDSVGPIQANVYDAVGNVLSGTNGDGNATVATYDALNRRIALTDPVGETVHTAYDADGEVLSVTDRNGNITTYTYDALNRQTSSLDALGNVSSNAYDPVGNLVAVTDPLGRTTTYVYDADDRQIQIIYPDSPSDSIYYTYDATGRTTSRIDQKGQTSTYRYNDFYYLTNRSYSIGTNDRFFYDLGGRLTTNYRGNWTNTFTYDGANRVLTNTQNGRAIIYNYNIPSGMRSITYPGGTIITETNDLRWRLDSLNDGSVVPLTHYVYDFDNNPLSRTNRNGTHALYQYDANDWVTNLTHSNAFLISGFSYTYDHEGNRLYQQNLVAPTASESYTYDALYRLTNFDVGTLSGAVIPSPTTAEKYGLDAVGNWTSYVSNALSQTRTHNAANELLTINATSLFYDADGNLTNDSAYSYGYDAENRLTAVTNLATHVMIGQYFYDAFGRRVRTVFSPNGIGTTNLYFYDNAPFSRILETEDVLGATAATFTYGNKTDEVITMKRVGSYYYYHPNAALSVQALTDASGAAVERYRYDAYGRPLILDGNSQPVALNAWGVPHSAVQNFYLFTGRQFDEEAGLYYYRTRYYDTAKGRFLQRDPSGYVDGFNLYQYVRDNPMTFTDPSGLDAKPKRKTGKGSDSKSDKVKDETALKTEVVLKYKYSYDASDDTLNVNNSTTGSTIGVAGMTAGVVNWFFGGTHDYWKQNDELSLDRTFKVSCICNVDPNTRQKNTKIAFGKDKGDGPNTKKGYTSIGIGVSWTFRGDVFVDVHSQWASELNFDGATITPTAKVGAGGVDLGASLTIPNKATVQSSWDADWTWTCE